MIRSASAVRTPPASAMSLARWMTGPSITGSEYGQLHLDDVDAGLDHGGHRGDAALDGREAGRHAAHQHGPALGAGLLEDVEMLTDPAPPWLTSMLALSRMPK